MNIIYSRNSINKKVASLVFFLNIGGSLLWYFLSFDHETKILPGLKRSSLCIA